MKKYSVHLNELKDLQYEAKFKSKGKNQAMPAGSNAALLGPGGASNYATNYSSNMPPI